MPLLRSGLRDWSDASILKPSFRAFLNQVFIAETTEAQRCTVYFVRHRDPLSLCKN